MSEAKQFDISKKAVIAAFQAVKENAGSYGADEQTIKEFEEHLNNNLYKLWNRMASGSYFPKPVRAVAIPKKNGGIRILGIPTVEDRIAQMVAKMYFEPLVEPMFYNDSYGYRPNKSAIQAVRQARIKLGVCELCGENTGDICMHHVKSLKSIKADNEWNTIMLTKRRKTLAVCPNCYAMITK